MLMESLYLALFLSFLLLLLVKVFLFSSPSSKKNLSPPSPPSFPIIGHLHLLKKPLHRTLAGLSARYGPVILLRFGSRPVLVVSSASLAEECFTKNDIAFASRPQLHSIRRLSYNYTTLSGAPYGPNWRNLRRIATVELLSSARLKSLSDIRAEEVRALMSRLFRESGGRDAEFAKVELKPRLFGLTLNVMMRTIAGKRYYREDMASHKESAQFMEMVEELLAVGGTSNVADFLPILRVIDFQGLSRRIDRLEKKKEEILQGLIDEHRRKGGGEGEGEESSDQRTIIGVLLSLQEKDPESYTDQFIKAFIITGHYATTVINRLRDIEVELVDMCEKRKAVEASNAKVNAAAVEAKSKTKAVEAEVARLKKALEEAEAVKAKVEANLFLKKNKQQEALANAAKAEKRAEDRVAKSRMQ